MRYRILGGTGIEVSTYCLGTMMFGAAGNPDHDDSIRVIHTALDHGINFVDTADMYSAGESEEIVGKALQGRRDDVVLATKVHFPMGEGPNRGGNSRRWITRAVEASLKRLRTDWIDLYQIHRPDHRTDIEETLSALTDLVRQGKIRAFGSSAFPAYETVEAYTWPGSAVCTGSVRSSRRTTSWPAASRATSFPRRSGSAWACSPTARWAGGS
ncbi:aldo/keto reductase [Nonomuraea wenchangensis]